MSRAAARPDTVSGAVRIRPVTAADLPAVLAMKNRSWRVAYGHALSAESLDEIDAGLPRQVEAWTHNIAAPGVTTVMAEQTRAEDPGTGPAEAGAVVGMACSGPRRSFGDAAVALAGTGLAEDDLPERELFSIYLDERAYGSGLGDRLIREVLGDAPAVLWVLAGNSRAEAFYRRHGFEALGVPAPLGARWGEHAERLYVRR